MARSWLFLVDPSTFILVFLAIGTIYFGSKRSLTFYSLSTAASASSDKDNGEIKVRTAIMLPIIGSIFLLILFYFLNIIYYLILVILSLSSIMAVGFVSYPTWEYFCNRYDIKKSWEVKYIETVNCPGIFSFITGLVIVSIWFISTFFSTPVDFLFVDVLSLCLAVASLTSIRLPNLKISTLILCLFFIYDIFWVFLSQYIFKSNVMVTVARKLPSLPMLIIVPRVLDDSASMLGLGDVVLPGVFLCFLYRWDHFNQVQFKKGYFLKACIGYVIGLFIAFLMVWGMERDQPALLYLVPFTVLPTIFFGWRNKNLHDLWHGLFSVVMEGEDIESNRETVIPSNEAEVPLLDPSEKSNL